MVGSDPQVCAYDLDQAVAVATIRLNRPESMNALTAELKVALRDALARAAADSQVRCVLLTGSGKAFCAGQDLPEHAEALRADPERVWATVPEHYIPIARSLVEMPKPVVAAVNGIAAGAGASIAFGCDFRILAADAGFNTAFAGIGLAADTGASWTLPRLIGYAPARDLLMRPRTVAAEEALALGLATEVVPAAELARTARDFAARLAAGPTRAYAGIKAGLNFSASHDLATSLQFEGEQMRLTGATADHRDAVAAFAAKQRPRFSGR